LLSGAAKSYIRSQVDIRNWDLLLKYHLLRFIAS